MLNMIDRNSKIYIDPPRRIHNQPKPTHPSRAQLSLSPFPQDHKQVLFTHSKQRKTSTAPLITQYNIAGDIHNNTR